MFTVTHAALLIGILALIVGAVAIVFWVGAHKEAVISRATIEALKKARLTKKDLEAAVANAIPSIPDTSVLERKTERLQLALQLAVEYLKSIHQTGDDLGDDKLAALERAVATAANTGASLPPPPRGGNLPPPLPK